MSPKVSVVIPLYRSGPGLDDAVASLERQTLPAQDVEVLLVDDGSPDDTFERARAICASRPGFEAVSIPASGWPSRPRNEGITRARGEYVLFMDHDDELYPDALRAAFELGVANRADVVNGKEVRTRQPRWGLSTFTADVGDAGDLPLRGLLPMTPHKLYRREFLLRHDLRFPEAPRHLWEDLFFNVAVLRHDPRVSVLSSVPFYHWRETGENSSGAADGTRLDYSGDPEYWTYLEKLLRTVATVEPASLRDELLAHNASLRLTSQIGARVARVDDAERAEVLGHVRRLLDTYVPPELDEHMPVRRRTALVLFRAGHVAEATEYLMEGAATPPRATATAVTAEDGALVVSGTVEWRAEDGSAPLLRRERGRGVVRDLSPGLTAALGSVGISTEPDLADAGVKLLVRHKKTHVTWELPTESTVRVAEDEPENLHPVASFTARLDPSTAGAGAPLAPGAYAVHAVAELEGRASARRLRAAVVAPAALGDGAPATPAVTPAGNLELHLHAPEDRASRKGLRRWLRRG